MTDQTKPLLNITGLDIAIENRHGHKRLVEDISLTLERGHVLGLIGESGAGKSTVARAVMGLYPPGAVATGDVDFDGTSMLTAPRRVIRDLLGRRIAYIAQDPRASVNPLKRVSVFLTEAMLTVEKMSRTAAEIRAGEALISVGLSPERIMSSYPHQLSGGMLQRVVIAAALTTSPDLLIADEPTTALDVTAQAEVMAILKHLVANQGFSMLLVTHNLEIAASICDKLMVLRDGNVVEQGATRNLMQNPCDSYTRQLLQATRAVAGALTDEVPTGAEPVRREL